MPEIEDTRENDSAKRRIPWPLWTPGPTSQFLALIVFAGAVSAGTTEMIILATNRLELFGGRRPEVLLPLILISGVIALVVALAILVAAFYLFGLTDKAKPFGVPEGTLQAVIALSLILIFAIASLYLRGTFNPQVVTVAGLTRTQVEQIPGDQIVGKVPNEKDKSLFDVQRRLPSDEDANDFSSQLLTILGTLVGAVAGFYFGAKSVESGVAAGGTNVKPLNTSPPGIDGPALAGETLRAKVGGWTGSPPPNYGHQWQWSRDGDVWRDISGANAPDYTVSSDYCGAMIRVLVTATNVAGSASKESQATDRVTAAPKTEKAPAIEGQAEVGSELKAVMGRSDWVAWPEPELRYQWERKAPEAAAWQPIEGASAETYLLGDDDLGSMIRVVVTATNLSGSGSKESEAVGPIGEATTTEEV